MVRARALLAAAGLLAGCRHHSPPEWTPSIRDPGSSAAPASPPVLPASVAGYAAAYPPPAPPSPPPSPPPLLAPPADAGVAFVASAAADGGTVNGHPRGPSAAALEATVRAAAPALTRCAQSESLPANVELSARARYRILPLGRPSGVEVEGPLPPDVLACVKTVVDGLRFAPFEGEPVPGDIPFTIKRSAP